MTAPNFEFTEVSVPWDRPITDRGDIRRTAVALHKAATGVPSDSDLADHTR